MKSLLPLLLLSQVSFAQLPNICGIESPPDKDCCGCAGDPVNFLTGFTYHDAVDVQTMTGLGDFVMKRYYMPIGRFGGSKSPLYSVIGRSWIGGAPPGPYGRYREGLDGGDERPVWSNDLFSFVAPCPTTGAGCTGIDAGIALVFTGDFHWTVFNRDGGVGFQTAYGRNPGIAERLEALSDGYRLIRPDGQQWFYRKMMGTNRNTHPVLLSEIRTPTGAPYLVVNYPATGCLNRVSSVVFATQESLSFSYDANCLLQSVSYVPSGGGAGSMLSSYAYFGSDAGLLGSAGPVVDQEKYSYAYAYGSLETYQVSQGDLPKALHSYSIADQGFPGTLFGKYFGFGYGADFGQSDFDAPQPDASADFLGCGVQTDDIDEFGTPLHSVPIQRIFVRTTTESSLSGGVPSSSSSLFTTYSSYNDDIFGRGDSVFATQVEDCGSAYCASADDGGPATIIKRIAPLAFNANNLCTDGRNGGSPAVAFAEQNRRGWWQATRTELNARGEQYPSASARGMVAPPAIAASGISYGTTQPLETAVLNSSASQQTAGSIRLNDRAEVTSALAGGPLSQRISDQRFVDAGVSDGGTPMRFRELDWVQGNTRLLDGGYASRAEGTFYRKARACSASSADPYERVLRIEGPCEISGPTATSCSGDAYPVTEFTYYDSSAAGNNKGRLQKVSRYPSFTTSSCGLELATTYGDYTAEGLPQTVTDSNGDATTFSYSGQRLVSKSLGGATWSYAYETDGSLRYVHAPDGNYEVFCRHGSVSGACNYSSALLPRVQWRAKSASSDGFQASEKIEYSYWEDGSLQSETFKDSAGQARRVAQHFPDISGRVTYDVVGSATSGAGSLKAVRSFDGNDNLTAVGSRFSGAPDFCGGGSTSCSSLFWDRADRLVQLDVHPASSSTERTCLDYDGQGNPRRVIQGCSAADVCTTNHSNGATSTCSSSGAPATDYDIDDFGRVIAVRAPWAGSGGTSETRYEYNALGLVTRRQTEVMRNNGSWEELTYDQLGRPLTRSSNGTGGAVQLYAFGYDTYVSGSGCPVSASAGKTLGRMTYRDDTFGRTVYQYDAFGRVRNEWGMRSGSTVFCDTAHTNPYYYPTTSYAYSLNGNVTSIVYPHGRTVSYAYGDGGLVDRVASISTTTYAIGVDGGGSWVDAGALLTTVTWEPYGGLSGYDFPVTSADGGYDRMQMVKSLLGAPESPVADSCAGALATSAPDGTGRTTSLRLDAYNASSLVGRVMRKEFAWNAEEQSGEQTCWPLTTGAAALGQTVQETKTYSYDWAHRLTKEARTGPRMTAGLGGVAVSGPQETSWGYSSRSNRVQQTVEGCSFDIQSPSGANRDLMTEVTPDAGAACQGRFSGPMLTWDDDGRLSTLAEWVEPSYWTATFNYGPATGALDSVYRAATIRLWSSAWNAVPTRYTYVNYTYQYYYDAWNRRRAKTFPNGRVQEFFYDTSHSMLAEVAPQKMIEPGGLSVDDYIWLDGQPVAMVRGTLSSSGRGQETWDLSCPKLSTAGYCGRYNFVSDLQRRVVAIVRRDTAEVVQAGAYDAFGNLNRIPAIMGMDSNAGGATLGVVSLPAGRKTLRARAEYVVAPYKAIQINAADAFPVSSAPVVNQFSTRVDVGTTSSATVTTPSGFTPYTTPPIPGVQLNDIEYTRSSGSNWMMTPLRGPGQYYDEEFDWFENWNRYYSPSLGRYLSPEPILQSPMYVRQMAQSGMSVPTYSYALNNPVGFVDPNGLEVRFAPNSPRSKTAYEAWKASGKFDYIWKSLENDKKVVFELRDRPGTGGGNAETYFSGCGEDGRPVVNMDFFWRSIDATRRSNKSFSEAGIVLHEAVHGQGHIGDGHAWWEQSYGRDPAVTNSVEHAAEYYQDLFDGTPGRNWFTP